MSRIRVHELARELGLDNKELLALLSEKNIDATSHMSSLPEDIADNIRRSVRGGRSFVAAKTNASAEKQAMDKQAAEKQPEAEKPAQSQPPKGKNIVRVFRPQNVRNASRFESDARRQGRRPLPPSQRPLPSGQRPLPPGQRPLPSGQRPLPPGQRPLPSGQRPLPPGRRPVPLGSKPPQREVRPQQISPVIPAVVKKDERQIKTAPEREYRQMKSAPASAATPLERRPSAQAKSPERAGAFTERPQRRAFAPQGIQRVQNETARFARAGQKTVPEQPRGSRARGYAGDVRVPRPEEQRDARREDRRERDFRRGKDDKRGREAVDVSAAALLEQQKAQRIKAKVKEKDFREKDFNKKEIDFEDRGKKRRREKPAPDFRKILTKPAPKKEEQIKFLVLPEILTLKELADKMKVVPSVIIKKLFLQGKSVTVNDEITFDDAEEIALSFDILCEKEKSVDVIEELLKEDEENEKKMRKRPPVVCVMGHVDHGKTSLLDAIRHTNVTGREAGGITQHIGAYVAEVNGELITFLDTPGHEAFTSMRMRGANSTDIAVLVVAADDGVMPQTIEAISHAKAAGTEIIVAINKIDKHGANVDRVKQELAEHDLVPEDWGGKTVCVPVSAVTKEGIPELLEMILLTAEMMELKADPERSARGIVIEAKLDRGKGSVATVLVQKGTLRIGDAVAAGSAHGKVRAMMDEKGRRVKEAGPSKPVEILGLNDVPHAGDVFVACETEKEARSFAETFISQNKAKLLKDTKARMSLDDLFTQIREGGLKELNIVVKADVQGSVEALSQSLLKLSNEEVVVKVIHGGVGAINESDVILASASNAVIIGFNVRPDATAKETAKSEGVDIRHYRVIYNAIDDVEAAMKGMLEPVFEEKVLGHAEVRQTFRASGVGTIAGAYILDGVFERNCKVRLRRGSDLMFDGPLASLKRFKDDVKEVKAGYECGFACENFNDIKENDLAEAYKMVEVER